MSGSSKMGFFLAAMLLLQGCVNKQEVLSMLVGKWQSPSPDAKTMIEEWMVISDHQWSGNGLETKGGDTLFQEELTIIQTDSGWYYKAHPRMAKYPTYFQIEEWRHHGFIAVNRKHDYPQEISYDIRRDTIFISLKGHPNFETEWSETYLLLRKF
jgi:hypothetical protein